MTKPSDKKRSRVVSKAQTSRKKQKPVVAPKARKAAKKQQQEDEEPVDAEGYENGDDADSGDENENETADGEGGEDAVEGDENGKSEDAAEDEEENEDAVEGKRANGRSPKKGKKSTTTVAKPRASAATKAKKIATTAAAAAKGKKSAKPATAKKKRKVRTQEDKLAENAPVSKPFYVENGSDWHATNIDFEELRVLRGMWELPSACHILWLLQNPLTLRFPHKVLDFESALLNPASSTLLEDVFTKLLLKKSERDCLSAGIGLKYEWWNKQLREYYMAMYDKWYALLRKAGERVPESFSDDEDEDNEDDQQVDVELTDDEWMTLDILKARLETLGVVCPLKVGISGGGTVYHKSYAELPVELRCKILYNLCEAVMDDPSNTEHIRLMEEDDMRVEPLGRDRAGNLFYFFPQFYEERRLYRLEVTASLSATNWDLWAKGDDAFRELLAGMNKIRGRKVAGEQELIDHLEVIVEQIADEAVEREKELEKATKRAILEAIPRKRSMRIQVKQLEQMEQQQQELETKRQLSLEEIADLKRAELLRKVELEAEREAREREKETQRLGQEQKEREAAVAERELRRQRRLEKERQEEAEQLRLETDRQKEKEARELRAKLRKAAEDDELMQQDAETTTRPNGL
ncbi:Exosome complex exonuclease rrp6-like protein, partial [Globisporangium splendens]